MRKFLFFRNIWFILVLSVISSACTNVNRPAMQQAATKPVVTEQEAKKQVASLEQIHSWHISGKIAVQTARDAGSASVDWIERSGHYTVSLMGPLGAHGMKLVGSPGEVTMTTSDGKEYTSNSAEKLLSERWGFRLPVSSLRYWIRGLPAPGMPAQYKYDNYRRLATLNQGNINVQYLHYTQLNGLYLPDRIYITSPTLKTKLLISEWRVNA